MGRAPDGFSLFSPRNNIMDQNTARNNAFAGYQLIASDGNKIAGNTAAVTPTVFSIEEDSTGNEVILNWVRSNDQSIHICKSVFKQNDMFPNNFSGPQQAIAIDKTC
jgi:parallel beta-helix repeat protein